MDVLEPFEPLSNDLVEHMDHLHALWMLWNQPTQMLPVSRERASDETELATWVLPDGSLAPAVQLRLASLQSREETRVTFENRCGRPVRWLWLDFQGHEVEYGILEPSHAVPQHTFVSHPWLVRDVETGQRMMLGRSQVIYGSKKPERVQVTFPPLLPWSTATHKHFPASYRQAARTLLLCHNRLATRGAAADDRSFEPGSSTAAGPNITTPSCTSEPRGAAPTKKLLELPASPQPPPGCWLFRWMTNRSNKPASRTWPHNHTTQHCHVLAPGTAGLPAAMAGTVQQDETDPAAALPLLPPLLPPPAAAAVPSAACTMPCSGQHHAGREAGDTRLPDSCPQLPDNCPQLPDSCTQHKQQAPSGQQQSAGECSSLQQASHPHSPQTAQSQGSPAASLSHNHSLQRPFHPCMGSSSAHLGALPVDLAVLIISFLAPPVYQCITLEADGHPDIDPALLPQDPFASRAAAAAGATAAE